MVTKFDGRLQALLDGQGLEPPPVVYTEGTVSALVRSGGEVIIHSASIAAGNSGGPLVNRRGEVVGINTWGYTEEDEGAFINAALTASEMIAFLQRNGVNPLFGIGLPPSQISPGQTSPGQKLPGQQPGGRVPGIFPGGADMSPADPDSSVSAVAPPLSIFLGGRNARHDAGQDAGQGIRPGAGQGVGQTRPDSGAAMREDSRLRGAAAGKALVEATQGDPQAMCLAGLYYLNGEEGFPEDAARAVYWLERAQAAGEPNATGLIGLLVLFDEEQRNPQRALALLRQSAASGEADALGVEPDYRESLRWARAAAGEGSALGRALLGFHYLDGLVVDEDLDEALRLARASAATGEFKGLALLAGLLFMGAEDAGEGEVLRVATSAAEAGERYAQGIMGYISVSGGDYVAAERWSREAAGQADALGSYVLGWLYHKGLVVGADPALAWAYASLAAEGIEDPGLEEAGPLLELIARDISMTDKKRGESIREGWLVDWGLRPPPAYPASPAYPTEAPFRGIIKPAF